jgi:isopentenyl-diphosphate delta-isomerase
VHIAESHARRKRDHLRICREEDVRAHGITTGLERYRLRHCALPGLRLEDVDLSTQFLGKALRAPVLISAITGGTASARQINLNLATAAQALGLAMGVGSQRSAIEHPRQARTYQVRPVASDILLFANLGAVQLNYGYGPAECRRAVEMIGADALVLHLNPLQEALQPHGNTDFAHLLEKIATVCRDLEAPVIVKEVGWGISESVARQLASAGVAAIDVSGAGGTSWSEVEKHRAESDSQRRVAAGFARWGIPTAEAILQAQRGAPNLPLIASGGIDSGPDAAVALALGADLVGLARPLLKPATRSAEAVTAELQVLIEGLRIAMFAAGIPDVPSFKAAPLDEDSCFSGCAEAGSAR